MAPAHNKHQTVACGRRSAALCAQQLHRLRLDSGRCHLDSNLGVIALAVVGAQQVLAQDKLVEEFVRRMSKAVLELPNHDSPENDLIAGGLSAQDAARSVEGLVDGVVRCLVKDLRVYSEEHNEPFSDKLPHMLESLDKSGPAPLLRSMMIVSGARGESCALDELQKAGISLDSLDWKAICCDVASA